MKNYSEFLNEASNQPEIQLIIDQLIKLRIGFNKSNIAPAQFRGYWIIKFAGQELSITALLKIKQVIPNFSIMVDPFSGRSELCISTGMAITY